MLLAEEEGSGPSRENLEIYQMQSRSTDTKTEQSTMMENNHKMKKVFFTLLLCYLSSFVLMVTSICTSSWYTTHPLAPLEQISYGSVGLIEHCSKTEGACTERKEVFKFSGDFWPYRPLKSMDFDVALLLLIITLVCTLSALGITLSLQKEVFKHKRWLKWLLLIVTLKSAVIGVSAMWYLDTHVRSEQFRQSWSSYVAWLSVGLSTLTNIPVVYVIRHKHPTSDNVKVDDVSLFGRTENKCNSLSSKKQHEHSKMKDFKYVDIHDVE